MRTIFARLLVIGGRLMYNNYDNYCPCTDKRRVYMKHTDIAELLGTPEKFYGREVTVCGWVRNLRDSSNVRFLAVNDGTSLASIQIVIDKTRLAPEAYEAANSVGCSLMAKGRAVIPGGGREKIEVSADSLTLLGACPADEYPIQPKRHTLEFLRTLPHLRVRTNIFGAMLRVRSELSAAIHKYFGDRGYVYIHTPIITGSDCEGAGEMFRVTTQPWDAAYDTAEVYFAEDFFGRRAGLTVSGQLEGEVAALAMGKIYTFGPTFRAEYSFTPRHAAEFWQVEPEVAFAELEDIIEIAEEMIKFIIRHVMERCPAELEFFNKFVQRGLVEKLSDVVNNKFDVITYTDAVEILKKSERKFNYPIEWGLDLQTEHERYIAEEVCGRPVFITHYPKQIKAFYMKQNPDGKTVAATDLLVPGVGEIIGCSEREADYEKLIAAMTERNMRIEEYKHYLDLRRFGSVPHSGFGLGLERMLMYITGIENIRDVVLYPRTAKDLK